MAKEIQKVLKLQIRGGAANPSPPVGPALGAAGVNIMEFCKQFNSRTQDKPGKVLPVAITVFKDKSFEFVVKTPPAAVQLLEAAKIKKGSGEPNRSKVATVSWDQVKAISEDKMVEKVPMPFLWVAHIDLIVIEVLQRLQIVLNNQHVFLINFVGTDPVFLQ